MPVSRQEGCMGTHECDRGLHASASGMSPGHCIRGSRRRMSEQKNRVCEYTGMRSQAAAHLSLMTGWLIS